MIWKPHVTVAAMIEEDGRFLFVQERIAGHTFINQPAGHLEEGEGLADAVIRETLEETAWHFRPDAVTGIYLWRHPESRDSFLRIAFSGVAFRHEAGRELDGEIEKVLWMTPDEVRRQPGRLRSPMVIQSLDDYLAGSAYPLSILTTID